MTGHQVQIEREVAASPDEVWRVLTDLDHAADTLSGVSRVERLTEGPYSVGTRWRETRKMFGKEATEEMRVTAVEAPARTTVEADSAGVHYVTVFTLTPAGDGTRLAMTFTARQPEPSRLQKVAWAVFGKLGIKATSKMMARDLEDIARRAEGKS